MEKVLRYSPLILRLQRLFISSKIEKLMAWHQDNKSSYGHIRHPTDSDEWNIFNENHALFAKEAWNVRLGLTSDGFNPFKSMYPSYSIWSVVMVTYNLPPWLCMRSSFMMLTLLIPGPKQPRNATDVYLQPLIDELKVLWYSGVQTYDAHKK